MSVYESLKKQQ